MARRLPSGPHVDCPRNGNGVRAPASGRDPRYAEASGRERLASPRIVAIGGGTAVNRRPLDSETRELGSLTLAGVAFLRLDYVLPRSLGSDERRVGRRDELIGRVVRLEKPHADADGDRKRIAT